MRKGLGRGAALLAMSGAASVVLTFGPGLAVAQADILDDKRCDDKKSEEWDLFGDKDKDRDKDDLDKDDKEVRASIDGDKDDLDRDKDDKDRDKDGKDGKDQDKDDWFDKDWFDKDKKRDCPVVGGVGVGGVGAGGAPVGGVGAGGGGMADDGSSPLLPLAGAGLGAILIGAGVNARRRNQGAG